MEEDINKSINLYGKWATIPHCLLSVTLGPKPSAFSNLAISAFFINKYYLNSQKS